MLSRNCTGKLQTHAAPCVETTPTITYHVEHMIAQAKGQSQLVLYLQTRYWNFCLSKVPRHSAGIIGRTMVHGMPLVARAHSTRVNYCKHAHKKYR